MSKGFCRFAFWLNVIAVTDFVIRVLVFRQHQSDISFVFAFVNTLFAWKWFWPRCEYDTSWYHHFVRHIKWRYLKWRHKK